MAALRPRSPQVLERLAPGRRFRQAVPAEVPVRQLVGLQHAGALAHGEEASVEGQLQRALGRLAARPRVVLFHQHVVVDVADRQRAMAPDAGEHLAQVRLLDRAEPGAAGLPVVLHGAHVEAQVPRRHVRQGVRPVFEDRFVDRSICT